MACSPAAELLLPSFPVVSICNALPFSSDLVALRTLSIYWNWVVYKLVTLVKKDSEEVDINPTRRRSAPHDGRRLTISWSSLSFLKPLLLATLVLQVGHSAPHIWRLFVIQASQKRCMHSGTTWGPLNVQRQMEHSKWLSTKNLRVERAGSRWFTSGFCGGEGIVGDVYEYNKRYFGAVEQLYK